MTDAAISYDCVTLFNKMNNPEIRVETQIEI